MKLFKKKENKPKLAPTQAAAEHAKLRCDYISYFSLKYKDELSMWENLITQSRQQRSQKMSIDQRLANLRESKSLLDGFHAWCAQREYGEEYFQFSYNTGGRSMYQRVLREIADCEKKI